MRKKRFIIALEKDGQIFFDDGHNQKEVDEVIAIFNAIGAPGDSLKIYEKAGKWYDLKQEFSNTPPRRTIGFK